MSLRTWEMALSQKLWTQEWGAGRPVVALHPLALESTAFAGLGRRLARRGVRTIAVDLPGFGRSPNASPSFRPPELAEPVLRLVRELPEPPVVLGMSMGGRVALELALLEPAALRGVVLVAPHLPWRNRRWLMGFARLLHPGLAERLPLERVWPLLKRLSAALEARPELEDDWLMRASAQVAYSLSCPASRASLLGAARDLALDPAFGPEGTWTRLEQLALPAAFVWAGRDRLIPTRHGAEVAALLPGAYHARVPCSGHFVNGRHHRCFERAMADAVMRVLRASERPRGRAGSRGAFVVARCLAEPKSASSARRTRARASG